MEVRGMQNPVVWFEVLGKNGGELRRFYSSVFGWEIQNASSDANYGLVMGENGGIGGGAGQSQDGGDGHVTVFIEVDDPAAYLAKVEQLGGAVVMPPTEIPELNLTFAYFSDPQGHVIGLSKGAVQ
jgi:predicted enzyme related to lactoylglutathione lyase